MSLKSFTVKAWFIILLVPLVFLNCGNRSMKLVAEADQARQLNKFEEAEKFYKQALKIDSNNGLAHNNYGILLQMQNRWQEALEHFQQASEKFDEVNEKAIALNNIGLNYDLQGDYDKAIEFYQKSISYDSNYHNSVTNLGSVFLVLQKYEQALEKFQEAAEIVEKSQLPFKSNQLQKINQFIARTYQNLGKFKDAEQIITQNIKTNPFIEANYYLLGDIYLKQKAFDEAKVEYDKALTLNPNYVPALAGLARTLAQTGKMEDALQRIEQAQMLTKDSLEIRISAGYIYLLQGDLKRAQQELEAGFQLDPHNRELQELQLALQEKSS